MGSDEILVFWPLSVLVIRLVHHYRPSSSNENQSKILQISFTANFCELLTKTEPKC